MLAAVTTAVLMVLPACTIGNVDDLRAEREGRASSTAPEQPLNDEIEQDSGPQPTTSDQPRETESSKEEPAPADFAGDLDSLIVPGTAIAVAGVGEAGAVSMPAWSTSKVPVAIAALRHDPANAQYVNAAISASDNAAAEAMWASMGEQAGSLTQAVLAEGGDTQTQVNTSVTRPGFTAFGQTMWSVSAQANFASQLRCIQGSESVVAAMGAASGQAYGLGTIPGAMFKGGWGPNTAGSYEVRQFGLVPAGGKYIAAAIAATSPDGSYEGGQALLNKVADNLRANLAEMPAAQC